jgi:transcriptional regulator with XRE-family HTH domain
MVVQDSGWWFLKTMIRKGRNAAGKSQRQIGDEIFRSKDTILDWEKGRVDIPASMVGDIAEACGLSDEICDYMKAVAKARRAGAPVEADMRFNALFLALLEEFAGFIFKFDAMIIPGPLQLRVYHFRVVRRADPFALTESNDNGWAFKEERAEVLEGRTDKPTMHFLIGETALIQLRRISEELYQEQMAHLRRWAKRRGVLIRILREPVLARLSSFSMFMEGGNPLACPPLVYTEIADSSYLINDPDRIASYDDLRKKLWKAAIRIEVYNDDDWRDRLA